MRLEKDLSFEKLMTIFYFLQIDIDCSHVIHAFEGDQFCAVMCPTRGFEGGECHSIEKKCLCLTALANMH